MVKQQNLEKITKFLKELSKNSAKIFEEFCEKYENFRVKLNLSFPIKFCQNLIEIIRFFWKNSKFPLALGWHRLPNTHIHKVLNYYLLSWRLTLEFQEKFKLQEENLRKIHKNSLASGGSAPEPTGRIKISIILIFWFNSVQKLHSIFENLLKFTLPISTNFLKFFLPSGASAPRDPHYSMSIFDFLFFP